MKLAATHAIDLAARGAVLSGFVRLLERLGDGSAKILRVLMYHRVDEPANHPELYPGLIGATPAEFDSQMRYLAANYRVVSMAEVFDALVHGAPLPPKPVLITFDDGYADFAEQAWPILRSHALPVTLFVPTAYPDQPSRAFWWDRLYGAIQNAQCETVPTPRGELPIVTPVQRGSAVRELMSSVKSLPHGQAQDLVAQVLRDLDAPPAKNPVLSWESLRSLATEGVTLAPHTRHHPLLSRVDAAVARDEISGSLSDLQREVKDVLPVLAYPSGAYNREVVELLPDLGIKLGFTTCRGLNDLRRTDPLRIRRINVGRRTSQAILRTQLLPCMVHLNRFQPLPAGV